MSGSVWNRPVDRRMFLKAGAASAATAMLAGCGSSDNGGGASSESKTKLSVMLFGGTEETDAFIRGTLLKEFSDESGYDVELQKSDWGSAFQKVTTAAASGTMPDATMVGGVWTAPLASKGALLGLDDYLAEWSDVENFYPAMIEDSKYEGTTYAMPLFADTRTALYRADLLQQAGVDPSALPTDWDGFRAVAEQVQAAGISGLTSAVDWGQDAGIGLQQTFAQLFLQAGGTYYDADGKAQFASDAGIAALDYLTSFYADGLADVNMVWQGSGPRPVVAGQAAMTFSGFFLVKDAKNNKPEVQSEIIAGQPLAATPGGDPVTTAWINKLGASADADDPGGAWKLVQQFVSKENAEKLCEMYGALPTRKDLADAPYLEDVPPALLEAAQYIVPQPPNPNMLTIAPEMTTLLQGAIREPGDSEGVLSRMDAKINEINGV